jgi:ribosomal protein S1
MSNSLVSTNSEPRSSINLPWAISSGTNVGRSTWSGLNKSNVKYSTPDEVRSQIQKNVIWDWVNHCTFHDEPITGRVARSLNQAGICVLLGGFPAFLPHRQYSFRNEFISMKQGQLESFQIISLKGPKKGSLAPSAEDKWNCVLSKDQFIRSCARKF